MQRNIPIVFVFVRVHFVFIKKQKYILFCTHTAAHIKGKNNNANEQNNNSNNTKRTEKKTVANEPTMEFYYAENNTAESI